MIIEFSLVSLPNDLSLKTKAPSHPSPSLNKMKNTKKKKKGGGGGGGALGGSRGRADTWFEPWLGQPSRFILESIHIKLRYRSQ